MPEPIGAGEPFGVPEGEGTAFLVDVGETKIAVKYAACGIVHGLTSGMVNVIKILTSLLIALGLMATGNTASPSEVVVVVIVSEVPSGHIICAVAVAPPTPSGLPSMIFVNLPKTLKLLVVLNAGEVSVTQPPQ